MGLDCGIRDGLDAGQMARRLQQYLQHPDKLFRRVRDERGILQLSQRAAQYHPGQGVYRSSYKNARRLAATETNIAYRTADYERWQQLDFIVGIEIHLSNNHTCLGKDGKPHPFYDICDELKGKYPKDFKFTGWHPHCRCVATIILKTNEELDADDERILQGGEPSDPNESENAVTELPDNFTKWVEDNQDRIARAKSQPYFLRDNERLLSEERARVAITLNTDEDIQTSGVTPDKKGTFVVATEAEILDNLRQLSLNYTHEEAYVVLEDGRVFHKKGEEGRVHFRDDERSLFAGGTVFHNHPNETLSPHDVLFGLHNGVKEIHAITHETDYCVNFMGIRLMIGKKEFMDLYNECGDEIAASMLTMNSKEYNQALMDFPHLNMAALCRRLGLVYSRTAIGTQK